MKFAHKFRVRAPLSAVAAFHRQAESMAAITPPFIPLQIESAPAILETGDTMAFTMWLGPIPIHWRAHIGQVSPTGFVDQQLEGPFRHWTHRHSFSKVNELTTDVIDEVHAGLLRHPLWGPIGSLMWMGLPLLFAFRGWKTRRLLEDRGDR